MASASSGPRVFIPATSRAEMDLRKAKRQLEQALERKGLGHLRHGLELAQAKVEKLERVLAEKRKAEVMARAVSRG